MISRNNEEIFLESREKNKNAFSLIELSIVLIIIGLLVAGITGGASLIESAKIRSFGNEMRNYKTQFYAFKTRNERWPGDYDNMGWLGYCHGLGCPGATSSTSTSIRKGKYTNFGGEYSGKTVANIAQPWVELYLEGIGEFKPKVGSNLSTDTTGIRFSRDGVMHITLNYPDENYPCLKSFNEFCIIVYNFKDYKNNSYTNYYMNNMGSDTLAFGIHFKKTAPEFSIDPKLLKKIDEKFDDGVFNSGIMRSRCQGTTETGANSASYDTAIREKKKCRTGQIYYQFAN